MSTLLPPPTASPSIQGPQWPLRSGGPGNTTDWVALSPLGAADGAYVDWRYLSGTTSPPGAGLTDATLTFYAPIAPGSYELRFFANNGYTRLATSGVITVAASPAQLVVNGVGAPASVSVVAGTSISVAVTAGPGNTTDWIALYRVGGADNAYLDWRYLNDTTVPPATGLTNATVTFLAPATPGDYEFRLLAHNGFGRLASSGVVTVVPSPAQLTVNGLAPPTAVSVGAGTHVSVEVTNGPANPGDWVALYPVNAGDGGYLTWRYLNGTTTLPVSGTPAATLDFAVPVTAGSYEFRFFAANGYVRLATSTTMVVSSSASQLSVNGVSSPQSVTAPAGSVGIVSVSGGPANRTDWVALYVAGAPDNAYVDWRYLSDTATPPATGVSTATLHFTMPTTAGTYEFRFFADGAYGLLATSGAVVVPPSPARIAVEGVLPPTSVTTQPGATVTIQVTNGPGNATDWVAVADASAPNSLYVGWQYLNGSTTPPAQGQSGATLTFVMPPSPGTYEVRLFANGGFNRVATSSSILSTNASPSVSITLTNPFPGTVFDAPASLTLEASATDSNGSIARVDFYAGSTLIGSATAAPYQAVWTSPPAGNHVLTAVATDNTGAVTTSQAVSIFIDNCGCGFNVLGRPIATPPGGLYTSNQLVSLGAAPGATIHYTTNGDYPTDQSPVYTGPIPIGQTTTLQAVAYQAGWEPSGVRTEMYRIDVTPPSITAHVSPGPSAAGWNNTPVEVSFLCTDPSGIASCSEPVSVTQEGTGFVVSGTATDNAGRSATTTITVNIDYEPAVVALTSPSTNSTTDAATVTLTGTMSDALSGVGPVTCNGIAATVAGNAVECVVPLAPGRNSVVLHGSDAAGNGMSAGVWITRTGTPTAIRLTPDTRTLVAGEAVRLKLIDNFGGSPASATWTSSNPEFVTTDAAGTVTGVAPGEATITASVSGLSASADVTVVGGATLPSGTVRWTMAPTPGLWHAPAIYTHRVDSTVPDFFGLEQNNDGSTILLTAMTADGEALWTEHAPGDVYFGDTFGGVVAEVRGTGGSRARALARIGGPPTTLPWRYQSRGFIRGAAQGPDGTIFAFELLPYTNRWGRPREDVALLVLDGATGRVKARLPQPRSSSKFTRLYDDMHPSDCSGDSGDDSGPVVLRLVVGSDGNAHTFVRRAIRHSTSFCHETARTVYEDNTLTLLRVSPSGAASPVILDRFQQSGDAIPTCAAWLPSGNELLPDDRGGMLASWFRQQCGPWPHTVTRFDGAGARVDNPSFGSILMTGDGGTAYVGDPSGSNITAVDVESWQPRWTSSVEGYTTAALFGGGVAIRAFDGTIHTLSSGGVVTSSVATPLTQSDPLGTNAWLGVTTGGRRAVVEAAPIEHGSFSYAQQNGSYQHQNAPNKLVTVTINTFIPEEWVDTPVEWLAWFTAGTTWSGDSIFEGDNRSCVPSDACWNIDGSSRSKQRVVVTQNGLLGPSQTIAGETRLYHKASSLDAQQQHITVAARNDTILHDGQMLIAVGRTTEQASATPTLLSNRTVRVILDFAGNDPLFNGGRVNDVTYEILVTIDFINMTYHIAGSHDGFPNYEVYINRQRVHHHDHGTYTPFALDPITEITFDHPAAEIQR